MNERLNDHDLELISAYLDSRLSAAELNQVKARIESDPQFKSSVDEIAYTRRLLKALPSRRAPRNFTLKSENVKAPRRALWLQPALSFVSIAAALVVIFVFSTSYLFSSSRSAAPAMVGLTTPAANSFAAEQAQTQPTNIPLINWNPAYGFGRGGGDMSPAENYTGGFGIGGAGGSGLGGAVPLMGGGVPVPTTPSATEVATTMGQGSGGGGSPIVATPPVATEAPLTTMSQPKSSDQDNSSSSGSDLTTLILGLPAKEAQGQVINPQPAATTRSASQSISSSLLIMLIAGATAILAGASALILHRRTWR